jgi:NSS family neurotransmitter:Na+ symporter
MAGIPQGERDSFSSRFGVIAAAAGSAIGLGNIWRFPYVAGENGGGAFLVVYLVSILIIGVPVMLSEFVIGRSAQKNPYGAFRDLAPGKPWYLIGLMGVAAAFMILAFYTVVAGWTLEYIYQSFTGNLVGKATEDLSHMFDSFRESVRPIIWFIIFIGLTAYIVISGIKNGIEKYTKLLMPLLLIMLVAMAVYVLTFEGASKGLTFLFKPDFSKLTPKVILEALGQAFFSLSIGMGTLITYGSYIRKNENLGSTAISVAGADTFIAILAGIAIFPAVFAFANIENLDVANISGEGLVFITLPSILYSIPGGQILSTMFFTLLAVAALTSTISVLEVIVAYFTEELGMVRRRATIVAVVSVSFLGILSVIFSGVFGFLNFTTANILLPVGGLFIVLFVGFFFGRKRTEEELSNQGKLKAKYIPAFRFIVRFIAPIVIAIIFIYGISNAFRNSGEAAEENTEQVQPVIEQG